MNSTATRVRLIQCQIEILKATILAGELVEHRADWLKNAKTVVRDKTGRFASKAASIKEDAQAVVKTGGDILNISADAISNMVKDPGFRKRAGLSASAMIGKSIGNLVAQAKIFPGLEAQIDKLIKEQEKKLQDIYGKDNNALSQAFKKVKLPQPPKDAPLKDKLEFQAARYKAFEETLESPYHRTTLDDVAAVAKASVPLAVGIGLNIGVDIAIPFLLGNPLPLGILAATSVASYAASEAASFGVKKLLDKSELTDNQKMVADVAVRVLAGGAVSGAASKVAGNIAEKAAADAAASKNLFFWAQSLDNQAPDLIFKDSEELADQLLRQEVVSKIYEVSGKKITLPSSTSEVTVRLDKSKFAIEVVSTDKDQVGRSAPVVIYGNLPKEFSSEWVENSSAKIRDIVANKLNRTLDENAATAIEEWFTKALKKKRWSF
jgi:hypothetical protein